MQSHEQKPQDRVAILVTYPESLIKESIDRGFPIMVDRRGDEWWIWIGHEPPTGIAMIFGHDGMSHQDQFLAKPAAKFLEKAAENNEIDRIPCELRNGSNSMTMYKPKP